MGVALLLFVPPAPLLAFSFPPVASREPSRGARNTAAQQRAVAHLRPAGRCRRDRSARGLFPKQGRLRGTRSLSEGHSLGCPPAVRSSLPGPDVVHKGGRPG